jgi:hypothetical protein
MFNGVCLSEIAMEKIMWERHISKLCLKFLKIHSWLLAALQKLSKAKVFDAGVV